MFDYIADGQTTIFDMLYPTFKIDKPIRSSQQQHTTV